MVDSAIGPVPQGWRVVPLGKILQRLESGMRPKGGVKGFDEGVPSIGAENINGLGKYDFSKEKFVPRSFFDTMRRGRVHGGDIFLYKDGAYIGRKALFRDDYPHAECVINEHVFSLRPALPITSNYLYFWLDTNENTIKIKQLNANAAQPGINQEGVRGLPVLLPNGALIDEFSKTIDPMLALLFNLAKLNRNLSTQRDLLLPKLISGEIDIRAASASLKEAAE
jgi:type I restriction enzyme S subunit